MRPLWLPLGCYHPPLEMRLGFGAPNRLQRIEYCAAKLGTAQQPISMRSMGLPLVDIQSTTQRITFQQICCILFATYLLFGVLVAIDPNAPHHFTDLMFQVENVIIHNNLSCIFFLFDALHVEEYNAEFNDTMIYLTIQCNTSWVL